MGSALDSASLIMYPSGYSDGVLGSAKPTDGSGDFTFTRGSNLSATRVGPNGYIEKGYENLLLQSNTFSDTSAWASSGLDTPESGYLGYDGTNDAWKITANSTNGYLRNFTTISGVQTHSFYVKEGNVSWFQIRVYTSVTESAWFDLSGDGALGSSSGISSSIESAGNGFFRCSFTTSGSVTQIRLFIGDNGSSSISAGDYLYIQDAMLNQGLVAYPYIETTTAPVAGGILEDEPRIDFSDGCGHLLLEPSRTNFIPHSEYLNAISSKSDSLEINTADTQSPEGVYNASKFDFTSGTRYIGDSIGTANDIVFSVFAKAGTHNFIQFVTSSNNLFAVNFDLSNGSSNVVGTAPSELQYDAEDYGNGWYRIWFYYDNAGVNSTIYCWIVDSITASRASSVSTSGDIYLYGFQAEQDATYPTSYIPTYGVSQTRLGDVYGGDDISSLVGDNQGTLFVEWEDNPFLNTDGYVNSIGLFQQTGFDKIYISGRSTSLRLTSDIHTNIIYTFSTSGSLKIAFKYNGSEVILFVNGVEAGRETQDETFNPTSFGNSSSTITAEIQENIKQILLFPTALSDDECIALTTI